MTFPVKTAYGGSRFNSLPSVELANDALRMNNHLSIGIAALGPLFIKSGLYEKWGISLLHNHWLLNEGEICVQSPGVHCGHREYITTPRDSSSTIGLWPINFVTCAPDGGLQPIEYSCDESLAGATQQLYDSGQFVRDFVEAVLGSGLEATFGLVASKTPVRPNHELVEHTNECRRVSVLRERPVGRSRNKLIQTAWFFAPTEESVACRLTCEWYCDVGTGHPRAHRAKHEFHAESNP